MFQLYGMNPGTGHLTNSQGGKIIKKVANLIKTAQRLTEWGVRKFWKLLQSEGEKNEIEHIVTKYLSTPS